MARYRKGQSGNPAGRPKGCKSAKSLVMIEYADEVLGDERYRALMKERVIRGQAQHLEILLHHYKFGKPVERHEVSGEDGGPIRVERTRAEMEAELAVIRKQLGERGFALD